MNSESLEVVIEQLSQLNSFRAINQAAIYLQASNESPDVMEERSFRLYAEVVTMLDKGNIRFENSESALKLTSFLTTILASKYNQMEELES